MPLIYDWNTMGSLLNKQCFIKGFQFFISYDRFKPLKQDICLNYQASITNYHMETHITRNTILLLLFRSCLKKSTPRLLSLRPTMWLPCEQIYISMPCIKGHWCLNKIPAMFAVCIFQIFFKDNLISWSKIRCILFVRTNGHHTASPNTSWLAFS